MRSMGLPRGLNAPWEEHPALTTHDAYACLVPGNPQQAAADSRDVRTRVKDFPAVETDKLPRELVPSALQGDEAALRMFLQLCVRRFDPDSSKSTAKAILNSNNMKKFECGGCAGNPERGLDNMRYGIFFSGGAVNAIVRARDESLTNAICWLYRCVESSSDPAFEISEVVAEHEMMSGTAIVTRARDKLQLRLPTPKKAGAARNGQVAIRHRIPAAIYAERSPIKLYAAAHRC